MSHISNFSDDIERDKWEYVAYINRLEFYSNDLVIGYKIRGKRRKSNQVKRGEIVEFTESSRKRLAFVASNTAVEFTWMITLTYPREYETNGKEVKKHLNRFLTWMRKARPEVQYLWFLEFQKRGAPHFHVLTNSPYDRDKVSKRWYGHVNSGDKRHIVAGTRVEKIRKRDGAKRYAMKYAHKMEQKKVPKNYRDVGRFWGYSRGVEPEVMASLEGVVIEKGELTQALNFWDYVGALEKRPLTTLYGVSGNAYEIMGALNANETE